MNCLLRLWWKLTLSPADYRHRWRDHQIANDLKELCGFFEIPLLVSQIWKHFNVPYHPTRAFDTIDNRLYAAAKARDVVLRRSYLYEAMRLVGDITNERLAALSSTPEWHEFNDWMKDQ